MLLLKIFITIIAKAVKAKSTIVISGSTGSVLPTQQESVSLLAL